MIQWYQDPSFSRGKRRRDARLQHAVAVRDAPRDRIEARPIRRMRQRSDQGARRSDGEPRVGVERDHVANAGRRRRRAVAPGEEARVGRAAQQAVQLVQLSALPLPAHPQALALVPAASAVEEQEAVAAVGRRTVQRVQARDPRGRRGEDRLVVRQRLARRIDPIREQREAQLLVRVGEEVQLELVDQRLGVGFAREQGGDHHQRAQLGRYATAQLQLRERRRPDLERDAAIRERDGEIGRGHQGQQREQQQQERARAGLRALRTSGRASSPTLRSANVAK